MFFFGKNANIPISAGIKDMIILPSMIEMIALIFEIDDLKINKKIVKWKLLNKKN